MACRDYTGSLRGVPGDRALAESRIIYVTGMKPKPPPDEHRAALQRALTAGLARARPAAAEQLRANPERFTLVSWTQLFYASVQRDIARDLPGLERLLREPVASPEERRDLDSIARRVGRFWHLFGDSLPFFGALIAKPDLRLTMADVHRYLGDRDGVAVRIRALLRAELLRAWDGDERVLLIGHSLGSVIAYDCLWELSREERHAGRVDQFVTLGSPLATRFIRRALKGAGRPGPERYPANIRRWANFAARGEIVALHPRLRPFFRRMLRYGLVESIDDRAALYNHFRGESGIDPHKSYGYLVNAAVAGLIGDWLTSAG
jgi:hypothetical protein